MSFPPPVLHRAVTFSHSLKFPTLLDSCGHLGLQLIHPQTQRVWCPRAGYPDPRAWDGGTTSLVVANPSAMDLGCLLPHQLPINSYFSSKVYFGGKFLTCSACIYSPDLFYKTLLIDVAETRK